MASLPMEYDQPEGEPAPDDTQMDDSELIAILQQHEMSAVGYQPGASDEISSQQEQALNYYYRVMDDVPAQEGCSSVVDGTVQVVIDNALAALLKPFVSSDETVRFAPRGPEDVQSAEQATEYVNYVFNCDNAGFLIFHDWFKDALLTKLGVVKCWWESETRIENMQQVPVPEHPMEASMLRAHPHYMGEEDGMAHLGQPVEDGRVKIENVPPEEFRVSPMSRTVAGAIYSAHVPLNVTRSDLIEMGVDPEIVETLPAISGSSIDNMLRVTRYQDERIGDEPIGAAHSSQERVALRDEYIRVDYDGDGVAELRRVLRVEDTLLLNEEVEDSPFATICPVPMPHKVFGLSLADLVIELQKINTVLWRQMLDNLYKSNNPRPVVGQNGIMDDGSTQETLEDTAPGAAILVKSLDAFRFDAVPFTSDKSFPMLEMIGNMVEERTGISRAGQGLDTNALRKSGQMTATEMAMVSAGKNARTEMIARIFAETGVKQLFKLILKLVGKHQQKARMIRLRNQWVPIDPRGWPDMDLEVSVGLGIGERSEQMAVADGVLQTMEVLAASPYANLIDAEKVYNAVKRKFTAAGIKNTDEYLNDPANQQGQPQQPPPSPEQQKAMAQAAAMQAKLQMDQQAQAAKLGMEAQSRQQDAQLNMATAQFEAQLATAKAHTEAGLAQQQMEMDAALALHKTHLDTQLAHHKAALSADAQVQIHKNRPGGDLSK